MTWLTALLELLARLFARRPPSPPPPGPAGPTAPTGPTAGPEPTTPIPEPPPEPTTPGRMPAGPIRARDPQGRPFAVTWAAIAAWWPEITAAAAEFGAPTARIAAHMLIESQGNRDAIQRNGSRWSFGLMQVVPYWHRALIERLAGRTFATDDEAGQAMIDAPSLAVRAGAAILRSNFDRHGSWDRASSAYFTGNPDWRGADTVNGNTGGQYRASLNAILSELWGMLGDDAPSPTGPAGPTGSTGPSGELTFGRVPHPPYTRDLISKPQGWGMDLLGPRANRGVVYHRTLGRSIRGTGSYFRLPSTGALTQYGVGGPPPCEPGEDGDIIMWADPLGPVSPWASGPADGLEGDGIAFHATYGANAINRDLIAIEISGMETDPVSDVTIEAVAAISAYWADQARIPWSGYPRNPHTGLVYTYWHTEFAAKRCPFDVVKAATPEIIARTKAMLRRHQEGG